MKRKFSIILGIYDLVLALGAVYSGLLMVDSEIEIFSKYPVQWLSKLPFSNWIIPGLIVIAVFGIGNAAAAIFSFKERSRQPWLASAAAGALLLICVVCQVLILGDWYLPTVEFMLVSIVQLFLSGISLSLT